VRERPAIDGHAPAYSRISLCSLYYGLISKSHAGQYVGTSCGCQAIPAPPPPTGTTTTTLPGSGGEALDQAMDNLVNAFLPVPLQTALRRLVLSGHAEFPAKGTLRGEATMVAPPAGGAAVTASASLGAVVVFKGKRKLRKPGVATLRLRLTPAGRHLLRRGRVTSLPLTLTVTFSGHAGTVTKSRTLTLTR